MRLNAQFGIGAHRATSVGANGINHNHTVKTNRPIGPTQRKEARASFNHQKGFGEQQKREWLFKNEKGKLKCLN